MSALSSMVALCRAADAHEMARDIAADGYARQARALVRLVRKDAPLLTRRYGPRVDHTAQYRDGFAYVPHSRRAQRLAGFVR